MFSLTSPTYYDQGIKLGKNKKETVYTGPMPLKGHGEHRYFYQVVALRKELEFDGDESAKREGGATYVDILRRLNKEDIVGWGEWVGVCERK